MSLTIGKRKELEKRLEALRHEQVVWSNKLAKQGGAAPGDDVLTKLLEIQAAIKTTEQALGLLASAEEVYNREQGRQRYRSSLDDSVGARGEVVDAIRARQSAAAAADAAITALGNALDQMRSASEDGLGAFDRWRRGVRVGTPDALGNDPWSLGMGYTHPDLHWFAHVLAQRLDETLRTRIKLHPYLQFNYPETPVKTLAACNESAAVTFTGSTGGVHEKLKKAAANA